MINHLLFQLLIDLGADIDRRVGYFNYTALMSAVFFNYRDTVTVLLDNGAGENKTKLLKQIKN